MPDAVEIAFHREAVSLFAGSPRVVVACSGGGDSVALLHLAARLSPKIRPALVIAHLDHALRRGSRADAWFVEGLAAKLGLPLVMDRIDVGRSCRKDESIEEAARRIRRGFLLDAAKSHGAHLIATGHTLDDQAETILMRLARGAGPTALSAMTPLGPGPFVKPLLSQTREALRGWLKRRRIPFNEDPSNSKLQFDRNRMRRLVIPVLTLTMNPAAARHIVEGAARLREDAVLLDTLARERFEAVSERRRDGFTIAAEDLRALPKPIASRVARIALDEAGCDPRRVSSRHVEAVLALASGKHPASVDLPGRTTARLRGRLVEFRPCRSPGKS
jgi:tRNA(Ile)-lysidine synthase